MFSPVGRRAGVSAEQTRRQLLEATMAVLRERGFEGARIADIARAAGVTSGAIYNHFASKADLVAAAVSAHSPDAVAELLSSASPGSVLEVFRSIGSTLPERADELAPVLLDLIVAGTRDPEVGAVVRAAFTERERLGTDVIRLGQDAGEVDGGLDAEALSRFATMVVLGSLAAAALDLKPVDPQRWGAVIHRVLGAVTPAQEDR